MAKAVLQAVLRMDDTQYQATLRRAERFAANAGKRIGQGLKVTAAATAAGATIAAALGARTFAAGLKGAYDMGGALSDLSSRTGAAAGDLLILGQALADNGVEAGRAGGIINKMQKTIGEAAKGSKAAAKAFAAIGVEVKELRQLNPTQQIQAIGRAINSIQDPAFRTAAAMEIFGRSGGELLTMFADDQAIGGAAKSLGRQAALLSSNASTFDTISDRLARSGLKLQGFFVGSAAVLAPAMLKFTESLDKADLASAGERFGKSIIDAANAFTGAFKDPGAILGPFDSLFKATLADGAMFLRDSIIKDLDKIGGVLKAGFATIFDGPIGSLMSGMMDAAAAFSAWVESGLNDAMTAMANSKIGKKLGFEATESAPSERALYHRNKKAMQGVVDAMKAGLTKAGGAAGKAMFSFRTTDFGKAGFQAKAKEQAQAIIATGARATGEWMGPQLPTPTAKANPFAKFTTMGFGASGLTSGGLGGQGGVSGGAYNSIRKGDAARMRAETEAALKAKEGIDKTNDHMETAIGLMRQVLT